MALARIERGRGSREKRLERVLSEGKKNDGWVTVLGTLTLEVFAQTSGDVNGIYPYPRKERGTLIFATFVYGDLESSK